MAHAMVSALRRMIERGDAEKIREYGRNIIGLPSEDFLEAHALLEAWENGRPLPAASVSRAHGSGAYMSKKNKERLDDAIAALKDTIKDALAKGIISIGTNVQGGVTATMPSETKKVCNLLGRLLHKRAMHKSVTRHENPSAPDPMRTDRFLHQIADDLDNNAGWGNQDNPWIKFLQSIGAYPTVVSNDVIESEPDIPGARAISCACSCVACRASQCGSCSRKSCDDPNCKNCPNVAAARGPREKVCDATDVMLRRQRRQLKEARAIDSGKLVNALPGTLTGDFGKRGPSDGELRKMQDEITPELVRRAYREHDFDSLLKFARSIGKGKRF